MGLRGRLTAQPGQTGRAGWLPSRASTECGTLAYPSGPSRAAATYASVSAVMTATKAMPVVSEPRLEPNPPRADTSPARACSGPDQRDLPGACRGGEHILGAGTVEAAARCRREEVVFHRPPATVLHCPGRGRQLRQSRAICFHDSARPAGT
jgi:hypothetical protein